MHQDYCYCAQYCVTNSNTTSKKMQIHVIYKAAKVFMSLPNDLKNEPIGPFKKQLKCVLTIAQGMGDWWLWFIFLSWLSHQNSG